MNLYCDDVRANSETVMNVLRMIKLFGWETRVGEVVSEKRENELDKIWKRKVLQMANNTVKCVSLLDEA